VTEPRHALRRVRTHVETNAAPRSLILRARGLMRTGRLNHAIEHAVLGKHADMTSSLDDDHFTQTLDVLHDQSNVWFANATFG